MDPKEIQRVAERQPFRPFGVRLTNGAEYVFNEPRDFGAAKSYRTIFLFGGDDWVLIDRDNIAEIFDSPNGA